MGGRERIATPAVSQRARQARIPDPEITIARPITIVIMLLLAQDKRERAWAT
jgi:hypothetical protein